MRASFNLPGAMWTALAVTALCSFERSQALSKVGMMEAICSVGCASGYSCSVCHICGADDEPSSTPLWDVGSGSDAFSCYAPVAADGVATGMSLFCLSCHDGATAMLPPDNLEWFLTPQISGVRPDRRTGHHPVSVEYPSVANPDYRPSERNRIGPLPLYNYFDIDRNQNHVECTSCHAPHNSVAEHSLRVQSEQHQLCYCCHNELPSLSRYVYVEMQQHGADPDNCRVCHNK